MNPFILSAALGVFLNFSAFPLLAADPAAGASCAGNPEGAKTCYGNGCFKCTSGVWAGQPILAGADTSTSCTTAGLIRWNGTTFQGCDGAAWIALGGGAGTPTGFSFTDQTGVSLGSVITSNEIALNGFTGPVAATCNGACSAIARNGTWGGLGVTGFVAGDTIAIRQTSSSSLGAATTASVTVGTTTSGTWSVTTGSTAVPSFGFTNQTGILAGATVTSNEVTLGTFTGPVGATCGAGCTAIARNRTWGGTSVTGFVSGDKIMIRQVASNVNASSTTTATVTVGTTTAPAWSVTTGDPCAAASPAAGAVCSDGSVYVGLSPDGNVKMYAMRCDQGMTWDGSTCAGTRATYVWGTAGTTTGVTNTTTGRANTTTLVTNYSALNDGYTTGVPAAQTCKNLTAGGHSDWYLPAKDELNVIWTSAGSTSAGVTSTYNNSFNVSGTYYWTASEYNGNAAYIERFNGGYQYNDAKDIGYPVRCVRR